MGTVLLPVFHYVGVATVAPRANDREWRPMTSEATDKRGTRAPEGAGNLSWTLALGKFECFGM